MGEVEEECDVVGLLAGDEGGESGRAEGVAIAVGCELWFQLSHSVRKRSCVMEWEVDGPELEMDDPVNPYLRDVAEVKDPVGGAGDTEEEDAGDGEEGSSKIGFLGRLGDGRLEWNEGCILMIMSIERTSMSD